MAGHLDRCRGRFPITDLGREILSENFQRFFLIVFGDDA